MQTILVPLLALLAFVATAAPPAPRLDLADLADPAFARYVDLRAVGTGLLDGDAAALTDAALALAEAERILLRPHKALPAGEVFPLAAKLAAEKGDAGSLDRLAKAAERAGKKGWSDQIAVARKLGSAARSADPLAVPIAEITAKQFEALYISARMVAAARLAGDAGALDDLERRLAVLPLCPEDRATVQRLIAEACESLPQQIDPTRAATAKALSRLAAASRGCDLMTGVGCGT